MNSKVQQTLNLVLEKFESGDIPEAVAYSMFPLPDVPSARWSLLNRTLMFLNGTMDARGIRQWNRANRFVKKGTKAFYILVPYIKSVEDEGDDQQVLVGFGLKPVFRVEDTDGEPLEYETIELPTFPLIDRAKSWGIDVKPSRVITAISAIICPARRKFPLPAPRNASFSTNWPTAHMNRIGRASNWSKPASRDCGGIGEPLPVPNGRKDRRPQSGQLLPLR